MKTYLDFEICDRPGKKTKWVNVFAKSNQALLGTIRWYAPWRQYCFYPEADTIFSEDCLEVIRCQILLLMAERKHK